MTLALLTPALLAAYRRTRYVVGDVVVRIGRRSAGASPLREAVFITAWNPYSRRMPVEWNRRMQARLVERLRAADYVPAVGADRGWSEDHLMVAMPAVKAAVLARRFRQNAIVVLRRGQVARLRVIGQP